MKCIQNSATNHYKLKCSHTTLCLSICGGHRFDIFGGVCKEPTQIKWIIKCVQFRMDGHFNVKPSHLICADGCHLPKNTFSIVHVHCTIECSNTHNHLKLAVNSIFRYIAWRSTTRIKWEKFKWWAQFRSPAYSLYLSHTNRPFNRH